MARGPNGLIKKHKKRRKPQHAQSVPNPHVEREAATPEWETVQARINANWETQGLASIHVLQRQTGDPGHFRVALFLVDIFGVGLREASLQANVPPHVMEPIVQTAKWHNVGTVPCPEERVRQLVLGSIVWARRHGFSTPKQALRVAQRVWGPASEIDDPQLAAFGLRHDARVPGDGELLGRISSERSRARRDGTGVEIIPFHEILPDISDGLTLIVEGDDEVPDGTYGFFEAYCADLDCDCRVIYLLAVSARQPQTILAHITLGFESEAFYREWMGGGEDDLFKSLKGPDLMAMAPQSAIASGLLRLVTPYLNKRRMNNFKRRYFLFKKTLAQQARGND